MKRKRTTVQALSTPSLPLQSTSEGTRDGFLQAISTKDSRMLANHILSLCGMDHKNNPPSKEFADLLSKAAVHVSEAAAVGIIHKLEESEKDFGHRSEYFGTARIPVDCIGIIANYLEVSDKIQLALLNKSWKVLSTSHYLWQVCDPFPVKSFNNYAGLRNYLNQNKQKFLGCRILQMPRIPTSSKLFQDIFKAMPLLNSISLFNVIGTTSVKHCISSAPNPAGLIQLSIGLSTRVCPLEITSALKIVGQNYTLHLIFYLISTFLFKPANLKAFSLAFWQDFRMDAGSFSMLGSSIAGLKQLKYLSLSQSVLYPENYLIEDDEMTDDVFETLAASGGGLRDIFLGSFHAVTSATWKVKFSCFSLCIF